MVRNFKSAAEKTDSLLPSTAGSIKLLLSPMPVCPDEMVYTKTVDAGLALRKEAASEGEKA